MTFRVYGMTECKARQIANATPPLPNESIEDWEERAQEKFEKLMSGGREVPVSASFDAPQFARQFMDMARKAGRVRNLTIRRPERIKVVRKGKPTERVVWVEYSQ